MKYSSSQAGFAHYLLVVILAAAIGIASFFAYRVYQLNNRHDSAKIAVISPTVAPSTSTSRLESPSYSPVSTARYLVITQWGVKLPATGALSNLQYKIVDGSARLYSPELYAKYDACGPGDHSLGALGRIPVASDRPDQQGIKAGTIGGYNYYYWEEQEPCVHGVPIDSPDARLEQTQDNNLIIEMRELTLKSSQ